MSLFYYHLSCFTPAYDPPTFDEDEDDAEEEEE